MLWHCIFNPFSKNITPWSFDGTVDFIRDIKKNEKFQLFCVIPFGNNTFDWIFFFSLFFFEWTKLSRHGSLEFIFMKMKCIKNEKSEAEIRESRNSHRHWWHCVQMVDVFFFYIKRERVMCWLLIVKLRKFFFELFLSLILTTKTTETTHLKLLEKYFSFKEMWINNYNCFLSNDIHLLCFVLLSV
jgi:hypothetical protein